VTLLVVAVGYGGSRNVPPSGAAHVVGVFVVVSIPIMLAASVLFIVTGFAVDHRSLYVRRMLWSTRIELARVRQIWRDPDAIKGSIRIFGNGGLYSFSGIYRSKRLGKYRLFATDPGRAVVMVHDAGTVVITPADPEAFLEHVRLLFPDAQGNPHEAPRSTPDRRTHPIS
jgi:hypothetical protein